MLHILICVFNSYNLHLFCAKDVARDNPSAHEAYYLVGRQLSNKSLKCGEQYSGCIRSLSQGVLDCFLVLFFNK